ncbi:MAG: hypothetical protein RLN62_02915 [Rickettsiales bacterium]
MFGLAGRVASSCVNFATRVTVNIMLSQKIRDNIGQSEVVSLPIESMQYFDTEVCLFGRDESVERG